MARIDFNTETNGASISIDSVKGPSFSGVYAAAVFPVSPVKFGLQISAPFYQNVWNKNEHQIFVNGVDKTALTVTEICDAIRSVFTSTGGGGMSAFGTLSTLAWDGSNALLTLTANAAITLTPGQRLSGILHVVQGGAGNYTLSINGVSFAINTAVGSITGIGWYIANNKINFSMDAQLSSSAIPVADTTAPTVSFATTSATNIRATFNEATTATLAGFSFKKGGAALAASAITQVSASVWDFTVATMAPGDTLLVSYNSTTGATVDSASNELVSFTDIPVTNTMVPTSGYFTWGVKASDLTIINNGLQKTGATGSSYARSNEQIGEGKVISFFEGNNAATFKKIVGISTNANPTAQTDFKQGFWLFSDGTLYALENGVATSTGFTYTNAGLWRYFRINLVNGATTLQKSMDGSAWTTVYTFTTALSGTYYCIVDIRDTNGELDNVRFD